MCNLMITRYYNCSFNIFKRSVEGNFLNHQIACKYLLFPLTIIILNQVYRKCKPGQFFHSFHQKSLYLCGFAGIIFIEKFPLFIYFARALCSKIWLANILLNPKKGWLSTTYPQNVHNILNRPTDQILLD